jgi:hypothetical protein
MPRFAQRLATSGKEKEHIASRLRHEPSKTPPKPDLHS